MLRFFKKKAGPPVASEVASRAFILKAQIVTGMAIPPPEIFEQMSQRLTADDRQQFLEKHRELQTQLADRLKDTGLWSSMSSSEQSFVLATPTQIDRRTMINVSWLMEAEECLLWALGYVEELPAYDTQSDVDHVKRLGSEDLVTVIRNAQLRDAEAISNARDVAELWHWRSRTRQLQEQGRPVQLPNDMTLDDIVRIAAERAAGNGLFDAIDGDFPAFGRSYARLTPDEWSQVTSIAMERHRALNWLCGYAPGNKWEKTPTDT